MTDDPWDAATSTVGAVDRAEECAQMVELPVMFDFLAPSGKNVRRTDPQENATGGYPHSCFRAAISIIHPTAKINPIMAEGAARGVIFDVGHGAGSFWFRMQSAVRQGFLPELHLYGFAHT